MTSTPTRSPRQRHGTRLEKRLAPRLSSREERAEERRTQLAQSALATLGELGYARTSLRDIAQNSEFTHGVVHYYFADKVELIAHCVRLYKEQCVNRYDEILRRSRSGQELLDRFADKLVDSLAAEAPSHRLWYDLRTQSLFEGAFRDEVLEIDRALQDLTWRVVDRYAELSGAPALVDPQAAYALVDGLFEKALLGYLSGDADAGPALAERVQWLLPRICPEDKSEDKPEDKAGDTSGATSAA